MPLQFDRQYALTVGDYKNGNGLKFTDHHITFDVSKSSSNRDSGNSASIEIYNLSKDELKTFETEYLYCALEVGYKGKYQEAGIPLAQLFSGEVVQMMTRKSGTDIVTQLILGSGYTDLNFSSLSTTVPAGKTVKDVINEVIKGMPGVSRGIFNGTNLNNPVVFGYPLTGSSRQMLDEITEANDLEYHVDNGILYVNDKKGALNTKAQATVLNQATGLIDTPYFIVGGRTHRGRNKDSDSKKKQFIRQGIYFSCLLNPEIAPGRIVKLESDDVSGYFKIDSARYSGSYHGGDWRIDGYCSLVQEETDETA